MDLTGRGDHKPKTVVVGAGSSKNISVDIPPRIQGVGSNELPANLTLYYNASFDVEGIPSICSESGELRVPLLAYGWCRRDVDFSLGEIEGAKLVKDTVIAPAWGSPFKICPRIDPDNSTECDYVGPTRYYLYPSVDASHVEAIIQDKGGRKCLRVNFSEAAPEKFNVKLIISLRNVDNETIQCEERVIRVKLVKGVDPAAALLGWLFGVAVLVLLSRLLGLGRKRATHPVPEVGIGGGHNREGGV